jgi:membrane protease YdiL (CAAX protease family)
MTVRLTDASGARNTFSPGSSTREPREIAVVAAVVMLPRLLHLVGGSEAVVVGLSLILTLFAGALVLWRWGVPIPWRAPWYRIALVTVALMAATVILPMGSSPGPEGGWGPGTLLVIAVLIVPAVASRELFYRGALYSVLEARWGAVAAVIGSAVVGVVPVVTATGIPDVAGALVVGLLLGLSRATTGSTVPAVLSQAALAIPLVVYVVL